MTVDVYDPAGRLIEQANPDRVKLLEKAPNAEFVRKRKGGRVVQINLRSHGDDSLQGSHRGDPRKYSHHSETEHENRADSNPGRGVWTLRQLPNHTAPIFGAVVNDCIRQLHPLEIESYEKTKKAA